MQPGTFSQIYIQVVFAVKGRQSLIPADLESDLYKYVAGIIENKGQKSLAVNGMRDHIHLFIGLNPDQKISDLVREVKKATNVWLNERMQSNFSWQAGYGAFSYSKSNRDQVIQYIKNQKEHHSKKSFMDEYKEFLEKFEIEYQERFLFEKVL